MDYFFVSIAGFALGVVIRSTLVFGWGGIGFILLLAAVYACVWYVDRAKIYATVALFLFAMFLGMERTHLAPQSLPPTFESFVGTDVSFEGIIATDPDIREASQRVTIRVEQGGMHTRILAVAPLYPALSYGEAVTVSGVLEKPEAFDGEGGRVFRYDRFLAKEGVFGMIEQAYVTVIAPPSGLFTHIRRALYDIKHTLARGIEAALPEPTAALADGLLVGGKQGLGKELTHAFTVSGLIAIVVLSGYNVMIVAEAILRSLSFLPKRFALSMAGLGIISFVVAAGSGSSALRAGLMACVALFARSTGRTYDALRALCFVVLVLTVWNPLLLVYDPGFQLSLIATLGLIIGTPLVEPRLVFIKSNLLREVVATTIAAHIAILPLLLYLTGNLSLVAFPANILVLPVIPIAMACSFVAGLVGIVLPAVAPLFGVPAYVVLSYIIAVGKHAAELPFAHITLPAFPLLLTVSAYALLWWWIQKLRTTPIVTPEPLKIARRTLPN